MMLRLSIVGKNDAMSEGHVRIKCFEIGIGNLVWLPSVLLDIICPPSGSQQTSRKNANNHDCERRKVEGKSEREKEGLKDARSGGRDGELA